MVATVPPFTNGEGSTAPTLPQPMPLTPGRGESAPGVSLQHELASDVASSSKVMTSSPSGRYAGDEVISGTQVLRKASMSPTALEAGAVSLVHGKSCPSSHTSGTMNDRFGVVETLCRSVER